MRKRYTNDGKYELTVIENIPASHFVYPVRGFVISGKIYFYFSFFELPPEVLKIMAVVPVPARQLKWFYFFLELGRKYRKIKKQINRLRGKLTERKN